jgi:hypothetical protein
VFFLAIMAKTPAPKRTAAAAALDAPSTPKRSRSKSDNASQAIDQPTFESELRDSQAEEAIILPADGSKAATIATTEAADEAADDVVDKLFEGGFATNLDGIA